MAHIRINPVGLVSGEPLPISPIHQYVTTVTAGESLDSLDASVTKEFSFTDEAFPNGFESIEHASHVSEAVAFAANQYADQLRRRYAYVSKVRRQLD